MSTSLFDQLQTTLGTAYRLERELGGGGMSRVFLAHESALGRKVVVKVVLPELAAGVSVDRFRREIQLAAQLQHPHIVPLLSAGESEGLPYFTMPYIVGESLRVKLARQGELPVSEVVRILRDVVSALAYAHENSIMHRDVKPDNVLLSGGVAVVTDFGVAKAVRDSSESPDATNLTSVGVALGTPAYMAPEQAAGSPQIDHRADIYALGVMAYEMLTGRTPFWGRSTQALLAAHVIEVPDPIERLRPAVPTVLGALVMQCLAKRPADRPQSAAEVMHVLDSFSTPGSGTIPTTVVAARPPQAGAAVPAPPARRLRGDRLVIAAAGVALVAGAVLWLRRPLGSAAPAAAAGPLVAESTAALKPTVRRADSAPAAPQERAREAAPGDSALPAATAVAPPPARPKSRRPAAAPVADPQPRAKEPSRDAAEARPSGPAPARRESMLPAPPTAGAAAPPSATSAQPESTAPSPAAQADVPTPAPSAPAPPPHAAPAAPPPAPAPAADPRPEIRGVIAAYGSAVESQNVDNIKRVYPGMTAAQQRGWEQFFETVRDVKAQLSVAQLDLSNATADAQVTGTYTYLNNSTRTTERLPVSFHATLRREAGGWRISQVR